MQFDWTTFALEALNFLVLLWILKRFLYRPVLAVLDARQQAMRDQAAAAEAIRQDANATKAQYEARLAEWKKEREQAWQALEQDLAQERTARLNTVKQEIASEREKARLHDESAAAMREEALVRQVTETVYRSVTAMLQRLASPELTLRILDIFEQDLAVLDEAERATLRDAAALLQPGETIDIATAHPIDATARQRLVQALSAVLERPLPSHFREQADMMAGLRVAVGQSLLQASLADELNFFRERDLHA